MKPINKAIDSQKIHVADTLSIVTTNSIYTFLVIDPVRLFGMLVGGSVGAHARAAYLTRSNLRPGMKAEVMVETCRGCRFIRTSTIRAVIHLKSEADDFHRKVTTQTGGARRVEVSV